MRIHVQNYIKQQNLISVIPSWLSFPKKIFKLPKHLYFTLIPGQSATFKTVYTGKCLHV